MLWMQCHDFRLVSIMPAVHCSPSTITGLSKLPVQAQQKYVDIAHIDLKRHCAAIMELQFRRIHLDIGMDDLNTRNVTISVVNTTAAKAAVSSVLFTQLIELLMHDNPTMSSHWGDNIYNIQSYCFIVHRAFFIHMAPNTNNAPILPSRAWWIPKPSVEQNLLSYFNHSIADIFCNYSARKLTKSILTDIIAHSQGFSVFEEESHFITIDRKFKLNATLHSMVLCNYCHLRDIANNTQSSYRVLEMQGNQHWELANCHNTHLPKNQTLQTN